MGRFGICSHIFNKEVYGPYLDTLEKFEKLTGNILAKGKQISNTLREANAFLNTEKELMIEWTNNVETVTENIDSYPEEYSRKYAEIRSIFNDGLDDLQKTAQEFMYGGVSKILCGENEKHWVKVRHVPQSSGGWHPVNDNLM